jgi:hypothetical protein
MCTPYPSHRLLAYHAPAPYEFVQDVFSTGL